MNKTRFVRGLLLIPFLFVCLGLFAQTKGYQLKISVTEKARVSL